MKLVIQRVSKARVTVIKTGKVSGEIGSGLFVLLGIKKGDTKKQADDLANKLIKLRIMSDPQEKMNLDIKESRGQILVVSQFTLYADTKGGNRPSFINAEDPVKAKILYEYFIATLKKSEVNIQTGSFGDYMQIQSELDGPVTIILEN